MTASMNGRIAVLVSGSGSNLQALLDDPVIRPHLVLVVSDRPGVHALERAEAAGVETSVIEPTGDREELSSAMAALLDERHVDLIVSAGYMRVLGSSVVDRWRDAWLNVHPALLPSFPGMHAVRDALDYGVKITGVTVHFVDEGVDSGPVVSQEAVAVGDDDDWDALEERVHAAEHRLLPAAVRAWLDGRIRLHGRTVTVV
jgi:phosphoribosylglycinamide formyltransferase-1